MRILFYVLTFLSIVFLGLVIKVVFRLAIRLAELAYRKLWQWLNQRLGRQPILLLDEDPSDSNGTQLVFVAGMALGALSADTIAPVSLIDLLYDLAIALPRMMLGGFLGLCVAEVYALLREREVTVRLLKYLASIPIVQSIHRYLSSLAVLVAPLVRQTNRGLDALNDLTERIVQRIPVRLALVILFVGAIFGCVFLYADVYALDAADSQQGQALASGIVEAIQTYKYATGEYPATLNDLVPQYILQIPRPARRYEYEYLTCRQGTGYLLYYRLQSTVGEYCGYGDRLQTWQCIPISNARFQNSSCDIPKP
jgi:hypothetical protein